MMKLLFVDDEPIIREGITRMIPYDELGIELTASCANAFEALDSMTDDMPDVLLTDIKMPRMDGLELIKRAKTLCPTLKCIVLSGYDEFSFAQKAISMGVREYLLKPCSREDLSQALGRMAEAVNQEHNAALAHRGAVETLVLRLTQLRPEKGAAAITAAQVEAAVRSGGGRDDALLREAYVFAVAHSGIGLSAPEWSLKTIQSTYMADGDLPTLVAEGLTRLSALGQKRAFVEQMCDYIHKHFGDPDLSLQFLANQVVHMNADYIGKEFTRETGMKLSAYLLNTRMEHAKALLAAPEEMHVYEVAERVGMGASPQYFSLLFRKYTGMTPKEYRQQALQEPGYLVN